MAHVAVEAVHAGHRVVERVVDRRATEVAVAGRYEALRDHLDERQRRLFLGNEARVIGRGGVALVERATGAARNVIRDGIKELAGELPVVAGRVRRPGGGRKPIEVTDPTLWADMERMIEPTTRGDPESPLRWTTKSCRELATALRAQGHQIGHSKVAELLHAHGYSLQATRKTVEGTEHEDRDAQFAHINTEVSRFQAQGQPVISVDTKKKELVGNFANGGREWQPAGTPVEVNVHDFPDPELGKAIPYGVYDVFRNEGWVNVGIDHDTSDFAVESIRRWWYEMGRAAYPEATDLLITADCGGSNGYRRRGWRVALQELADEIGVALSVCHYPPGTSKWNKIEHRLFCHITRNWRGRPLLTHEVVVSLIGSTRTRKGLTVRAALDEGTYPLGRVPSKDQLDSLNIERAAFHGEWNYTVLARTE